MVININHNKKDIECKNIELEKVWVCDWLLKKYYYQRKKYKLQVASTIVKSIYS